LIQPPQTFTRANPSNREGVAEDRTLLFGGAPLATRPLHKLAGRPTGTMQTAVQYMFAKIGLVTGKGSAGDSL
jgi:hypothetical protein